MWNHAMKLLTREWDIFQGDRSEDLAINDDLADTDARVSKCPQMLLESTFLLQIKPEKEKWKKEAHVIFF